MFRRSYGFIWLFAFCFYVSATHGQDASSATSPPCDKRCKQRKIDDLFKALDEEGLRSTDEHRRAAEDASAPAPATSARTIPPQPRALLGK
jgi:hypothetical protein